MVILLSAFLGTWAIWVMRKSKLNVFPDVLQGAGLIVIGPYRYIRHPMYLAVIGCGAALLIDYFTYFRLMVFIVLIIDLILKIEYEEKLLKAAFDQYVDYRQVTKKLIPFIY